MHLSPPARTCSLSLAALAASALRPDTCSRAWSLSFTAVASICSLAAYLDLQLSSSSLARPSCFSRLLLFRFRAPLSPSSCDSLERAALSWDCGQAGGRCEGGGRDHGVRQGPVSERA